MLMKNGDIDSYDPSGHVSLLVKLSRLSLNDHLHPADCAAFLQPITEDKQHRKIDHRFEQIISGYNIVA
jgi:hypothetical protein